MYIKLNGKCILILKMSSVYKYHADNHFPNEVSEEVG